VTITPEQERPTRPGPGAWFTGTVWIDPVVTGNPPSNLSAARVTFAPGARTAWHSHPRGQALYVLSGIGRVQLHGRAPQVLRTGDSVWIEAGELHWHGAAADRTFVHLAMQETDDAGVNVVWLDHVTDEEYSAPPGNPD
jgi:quercetin dioxygenase-like cupin family protein